MNFEQKFSLAVTNERNSTHLVVELIYEAMRTQHHLTEGFRSVSDWLIKAHKYSETSANRRIQAARMLGAVPEVFEKLATGEVNLTTLTQVQGTIRREEMRTGERLSPETKQELIAAIENKTEDETRHLLVEIYPDATPIKESLRPVNAKESKFTTVFDAEILMLLERAKELCAETSETETLRTVLKDFVKRKDPKTTRPAADSESRASLRRRVLARGCEFEKEGQRCGSRTQLEEDHIIPLACGGEDTEQNLRCLCKQHNLLAAQLVFGAEHMAQWRRDPVLHN